MPKFARFDPTLATAPVSGWYDTDEHEYAELPSENTLLAMTEDEWSAHMNDPQQLYAVQSGALIAYTPPPPVLTLAQQAVVAMNAGLTIALSGSLVLAATVFPTDTETQSKLAGVATTINATAAFPGGADSYPMKDSTGAWHTFTLGQYKAVSGAIAAFAATLHLIIDGNPLGATTLPAASVSLTV